MLVLLIIFMVLSPLLIQGIEVNLPKTDTTKMSVTSEPLVISIDKLGEYYINLGEEQLPISLMELKNKAKIIFQANPDVDAVLSVGPHVCVGVQQAIDELGMSVHHSCFDLSPPVMDLINAGKVQYTIDQQQRLQGYMPIIVLHLYNNGAGLLPGANIPSGPGFVDKSNASSVASLAGVDR